MVTGFVAVGILSDQARDVWLDASCGLDRGSEQGVQTVEIPFVSTEDVLLSDHVMGRGKEVLPTVGFCEVEVYFSRVKSFYPSTLSFGLDEP